MARLGAPVNDGTTGATRLREITPDDDNDLPLGACAAIWVGVTGDVAVIAADDTAEMTIPNVPVGWLVVAARRVLETGTTATDLIAGYN